jgi:NAD+ kinase
VVPHSNKDPDIAVVVGADGTFGYYGRALRIQVLFVASNDKDILGSKAKLVEVSFKDLPTAIADINRGSYTLERRKMFTVFLKNKSNHRFTNEEPVDVLTDIYVERGIFAGCIRYRLSVVRNKPEIPNNSLQSTITIQKVYRIWHREWHNYLYFIWSIRLLFLSRQSHYVYLQH